jgi:adenylate cyclase
MMHRTDYHDFDKARLMLEHLITRSQRHPVPHAWLAKWHVLKVAQGWTDDVDQETKLALDCSKKALDIESSNSLALTIDGLVHVNLMRDPDFADKQYERAIEVNPNESLAWLLKGTLHAFKSEGAQAMSDTEHALKLSPLDPIKYFYDSLAATAALSAGEYGRAVELGKRSLRSNKTHTSTLRALIIAYVQSGNIHEARALASEYIKLDPEFSIQNFLVRTPAAQSSLGQIAVDSFRAVGLAE